MLSAVFFGAALLAPPRARHARAPRHARTPPALMAELPRQLQALPIAPQLDRICASLGDSPNLVLQAEPGAGKTTAVPLALLVPLGARVLEPLANLLTGAVGLFADEPPTVL